MHVSNREVLHNKKPFKISRLKSVNKQVDVLTSKTQALCKLTIVTLLLFIFNVLFKVLLRVFNDVTSKPCEQRIITKEHIAMHKNLILLLYIPVNYQ